MKREGSSFLTQRRRRLQAASAAARGVSGASATYSCRLRSSHACPHKARAHHSPHVSAGPRMSLRSQNVLAEVTGCPVSVLVPECPMSVSVPACPVLVPVSQCPTTRTGPRKSALRQPQSQNAPHGPRMSSVSAGHVVAGR
eukprot:164521-Rhodomonas_salina.2